MPLPAATAGRKLEHRRTIAVQLYSRDDGLWEVDATLVDSKTRAVVLGDELRPAGEPVHEMLLRLVIDTRFNVLAAGSETRAMPYPGFCTEHGDAYAKLVGLNLVNGFRKAVLERLAGVHGCTHLTELATLLPTAVIQAFAGTVIHPQADVTGATKPFQIDRCHALRSEGEVVRLHYPRWAARREAARPEAVPAADSLLSAVSRRA